MYAFAAVIFLAILLVQAIAFMVTRASFAIYTAEEMRQEANHIAYILSIEFSKTQRWSKIDFNNYLNLFWPVDSEVSLIQDEILVSQNLPGDPQSSQADVESVSDLYNYEPLEHIVVTDLQDNIIFDNLASVYQDPLTKKPKGVRAVIKDFSKQTDVGYVFFNSNEQLQKKETYDFLLFSFSITAAGGVLTLAISLVVSFYLSKKISGPVSILTKDSERLLKEYDTDCDYPDTKNEVEALKYTYNKLVETIKTQKYLRQRLLSDLSHEINTPLSVIQLEAKGLADGFQSPEEASQHISSEISKLKHLIEDLNWIAETDVGKVPMMLESFNLISAIREELTRWASIIKTQHKTIEFDKIGIEADWFIKADHLRLMQAFSNVVGNAINYTPGGGLIQVSVSLHPEYFSIRINDNGIGISPENLPHVMSRFYRADESRNRHTGGRGIGLSIVRSVVEAHQGKVNIYSEGLGKGCTVEFHMPLSMLVRMA